MRYEEITQIVHEARLSRSLVAFIDGQPERSSLPIGSGTLVTYRKIGGILTCAHVIDELKQKEIIGIVTFPVRSNTPQNTCLSGSVLNYVKLGEPPWTDGAIDLGFVALDPSTFARISALGSPVDLERQATLLSQDPPRTEAIDSVSGVVGEWCTNSRIPLPTTSITRGLISQGTILRRHDPGSIADLVTFAPEDGPALTPDSYGGVSGGPLWQTYIRKVSEDNFELQESRLVGVAVRQTELPRKIICHGPNALFDALLPAIDHYLGQISC